jgi:hypothetical protein
VDGAGDDGDGRLAAINCDQLAGDDDAGRARVMRMTTVTVVQTDPAMARWASNA